MVNAALASSVGTPASHLWNTRALSIRQPWAELILLGRKTIEVRSWKTAYRGKLLIHASAKVDRSDAQRLGIKLETTMTSALVGYCELLDCIPFSPITWEDWRLQHLNEGPMLKPYFAWQVANPRCIKPLPMKGSLGLMRIAKDVEDRLEDLL